MTRKNIFASFCLQFNNVSLQKGLPVVKLPLVWKYCTVRTDRISGAEKHIFYNNVPLLSGAAVAFVPFFLFLSFWTVRKATSFPDCARITTTRWLSNIMPFCQEPFIRPLRELHFLLFSYSYSCIYSYRMTIHFYFTQGGSTTM